MSMGFKLFIVGYMIGLPVFLWAGPPPGYRLIWSDEFNGATLDTKKWNRYTSPKRDGINTKEAIKVVDGRLEISTYTSNSVNYTGMMSTDFWFNFRYGYIEARVKFGDTKGMWSSFWLFTDRVGKYIYNPALSGMEIDIFEHRGVDAGGHPIKERIGRGLNWNGYGPYRTILYQVTSDVGVDEGYHTFGMKWTPQLYSYSIDKSEPWTIFVPTSARNERIMLSSEIVNAYGWCGRPPRGGYGSLEDTQTKFKVDYVRVYQKPPVINSLTNMILRGETAAWCIPFSVEDVETEPWLITVSASITNNSSFITNMVITDGANPWMSKDIGYVSTTTSTHVSGSFITLVGAGEGFGGREDAGRFLSQPLVGDGDIQVVVDRMENTNNEATAGIMVRSENTKTAKNVYLYVTPEGMVVFQHRSSAGGKTYQGGTIITTEFPVRLRLERKGDVFIASAKRNKWGKWKLLCRKEIALGNAQAGLAVSSHKPDVFCNTLFRSLSGSLLTGGERLLVVCPTVEGSGEVSVDVTARDEWLEATQSFSIAK